MRSPARCSRSKLMRLFSRTWFAKRATRSAVGSVHAQFIPTGVKSGWNAFQKAGARRTKFEEVSSANHLTRLRCEVDILVNNARVLKEAPIGMVSKVEATR